MGFLGGSDSKEATCSEGDLSLSPGSGRSPEGGHGNPLQYSCLQNPHGQRSLAGYSPRGRKESDTTEQLSLHSGGASGKEPACQSRRLKKRGFDPWEGQVPWRRA